MFPADTESRPPRYPDADGQPTLDTWQDAPHNRWAFAHVSEFVSTVPIARAARDGDAVVDLHRATGVPGLRQRLEDSFTDAFVVDRGGATLASYFRPGFGERDAHLLMSVSKSVCGVAVGSLVDDGLIDTGEAVRAYVPELTGSAYGDATVAQVLDMTVAVDYDEDYRDPASHVQAQDRIAGWRPRRDGDPADTYEFLRGLRASGEHGRRFQYCSADTDVLAWIVEAVTGQRYADVIAERLWQRLGCEQNASITVDAAGFPFANGGISCTANDLVRLGRLMLGGGELDGERIVSADWVAQTMAGGDPSLARGLTIQQVHPRVSYRNQWWSTGNDRGVVYAVGIHGQYIWLDPPTDTVIVKLSSCPEPVTAEWNRVHAMLFQEVCAAI
ncbi:class C beta-lactamase-related serine hydrolase [Microbacterium bovistercoris]|uniref:Class C beta-lactamase-related serine hydrolase n=1 Tax=Microbacterium bovistercoris TaxID=2293570 RepID=A0A371NQI3_9MICO|nr:class C beta-lactamase-related serine hydrolase [Microbacterium bovistercoris]